MYFVAVGALFRGLAQLEERSCGALLEQLCLRNHPQSFFPVDEILPDIHTLCSPIIRSIALMSRGLSFIEVTYAAPQCNIALASISSETGRRVHRVYLVTSQYSKLEEWYHMFMSGSLREGNGISGRI